MTKQKIKIDEALCIGCELCVNACKEGALQLVDSKAKLVEENHCDGLGRCLPICPTNAISFEEVDVSVEATIPKETPSRSALKQWPLQIQLVSPNAPFFQNAHLLTAADCAAFAYQNFHEDYIRDRAIVIGCPKLDAVDYAEKLELILRTNDIQSVTIVRMEVPCCAGLAEAAKRAIQACGKTIPWQVVTFSLDGRVLEV